MSDAEQEQTVSKNQRFRKDKRALSFTPSGRTETYMSSLSLGYR